jgi:aryl-alcohol dehydrogenase-like predicted oxidoreductase
MKIRKLGNGGIATGEIGLGCWQLGGGWGDPVETDTALDILAASVENGVTFFDTADVYGGGRSERLIGEFLSTSSTPITVATKFGRNGDVYPDKYSETLLRQSVEASKQRLGVDALDLLQLHCIPTHVLRQGDIFDWLRRLQQEGQIRHFGASVESVEEGLICLEQEGLLSLQVIFNIFRQKLVQELFPHAHRRGVGIIVRLPLASGLLTGKFTAASRFSDTDHRNFNCDGQSFNVGETFAGLPFAEGVKLAETVKEWVPVGMTLTQMALRWILDHEAVSVVIPGASSPGQAADNASATQLPPLPPELHKALFDFYQAEIHPKIRGPY